MSVVGSLDAIAYKAQENMSGLKRCYAVGVTNVRPIPRSIDDGPVGTVWVGSGEMNGGNAEHVVMSVTLDIWTLSGTNPGLANKALAQFIDRARTAFRADMNLGGEATRCEMVGWEQPEPVEEAGKQYLVLPIKLEVLITRYGADATA